LFIEQVQSGVNQTVVPPTNTGPVGSQSAPTRLQLDSAFTVYVDVQKNAYNGKTLFLYMQDTQYGSGATNNWYLQGTPLISSLQFSLDQTYSNTSTIVDRYKLFIPIHKYPELMNATNYWNTLSDGSIIRPTFYIGWISTANLNANQPANWGDAAINFTDIWAYKNIPVPFSINLATSDIVIEIDQYTPINKNLEQMLRDEGHLLASITEYSWYMDDQYGVSPYTYTVNNRSAWLNNIYQDGFKPWINSSHIDWTNPDFLSTNSNGDSCYVLCYYVIPKANVPAGGFVSGTVFNTQARRVIVKIKPSVPPSLANPITVAFQDYGTAAAGAQWGTALPSGETNYAFAGSNLPGDGKYAIAQDILGEIPGDGRPPDWYVPAGGAWAPAKKYDHTSGDGTGFMYIVNAEGAGGVFYKETFDVCPNMNLQFSMWLTNICDGTRADNAWSSKYRIKPNVHIQIWPDSLTMLPSSGTPLLDYYTGEIPMTGNWEQYITPVFEVGNETQITVFYLSINGGGDGNDFMMDDIRIQRSNGTFDFTLTETCSCQDPTQPYEIHANWDPVMMQQIYGENFSSLTFHYKWSVYPLTDIKNISGAGQLVTKFSDTSPDVTGTATYSSTSDIHIEIAGTQDGVYKLAIAATAEDLDLDDECAIYSYYAFTPNHPPTIHSTKNLEDEICPGDTVKLHMGEDFVEIQGFDKRNLLWFTVEGSDTIPLLDAHGNQIYGDTISVVPFKTTKYLVKLGICYAEIECEVSNQGSNSIRFGPDVNPPIVHYVHRVCYSATSVSIPATNISASNITYKVFQDGTCNVTPLAQGNLTPNIGESISFDLSSIKPTLDNFRKGKNTVTCALVYDAGCGNFQTFDIRFISDSSVWVPSLNTTSATDYNNWNNDKNWYITDKYGNRYAEAGIPMACTHVVIPCDAMNYPILKAAADYGIGDNLPADDGFLPQPKCNTITFKFGGEVAQLQHLQYLKAYVEMNLGTYRSDSSFINTANLINTDGKYNYYPNFVARDRYYSMSAPLKDMYSGDFAFGGKPNVYMKYADTIAVEAVRNDKYAELGQKWTNSINNYNIPLPAGFGFGYQVFSGDLKETWPYQRNQKNLNSASGIVKWPYFQDKAYLDSINPRHKYENGISTFTYFPVGTPNSPRSDSTNTIVRQFTAIGSEPGGVPLANRFILENNMNVIPPDSVIAFRPEQVGHEILVGNPFMSHLDFKQFYLENKNTIGTYYRIWLGTSNQYYSLLVNEADGNLSASTNPAIQGDSLGNDLLIAPMQSFFVPIRSNPDPTENSITFNIASMSKVFPNKLTALRSSNANEVSSREILKIKAANSRYSAAAVIIHKPGEKTLGEGVPKLFSPSGNIPEVYLIQDYKKEIIEINETPQAIPLEIKTGVTGSALTLTFSGLENFSSKVILKDTKTGESKMLSATDNVYSFMNYEGDQKNRFFLLFNDYTGIEKPASDLISVFATNNHIFANASSLDPLHSVQIYNSMGQLVEAVEQLSATAYESRYIGEKGVYIIQIKTKNNTSVTKKIII
jgi:hypothetical protein